MSEEKISVELRRDQWDLILLTLARTRLPPTSNGNYQNFQDLPLLWRVKVKQNPRTPAKSGRKTIVNNVPIIVTTLHKGVFFGYGQPSDASSIRIEKARMVVYWSTDVRSVVGLASTGPSKGCKIGTAAVAITLRDVTSVIECSKEAAEKFEGAEWK